MPVSNQSPKKKLDLVSVVTFDITNHFPEDLNSHTIIVSLLAHPSRPSLWVDR